MIIKEGSADEIHNWFITETTDEIVLCIFLGSRPSEIELLSDLIDQASHIDTIIGEKIGFLLCAPGIRSASSLNAGGGEHHLIGAQYKRNSLDAVRARDLISEFDIEHLRSGPQEYYREASIALARSTSSLVPEFMEFYGIQRNEVPCIVSLFKGVHDYGVTKCPPNFTVESFIEWLSSVRDVIDMVERDLLFKDFGDWDMQARVARSNDYHIEMQAKLRKIDKAIVGICNKYIQSPEEALTIVSSFTSVDLDKGSKSQVMQRIHRDYPSSAGDNRWAKIFSLQDRVDELKSLDIASLDRRALQSLSDKLEGERAKLHSISAAISELRIHGAEGRSGRRGAFPQHRRGGWNTVEKVNTAADVAGKINSALKVIARYLAIGA